MIILKSNQGLLRKEEKQPVDFLTLVAIRFSEKKKKKLTLKSSWGSLRQPSLTVSDTQGLYMNKDMLIGARIFLCRVLTSQISF